MKDNNFPLEKILNVSMTEYCSSAEKALRDFTLTGVHAVEEGYNKKTISDILDLLSQNIPRGAEVVVGYKVEIAGTTGGGPRAYASGVALTPKK